MLFGRKKKARKEAERVAAEQANPLRLLSKDARDEFGKQLQDDEAILVVIPGEWEGAMVATTKRLYVFKKGAMGGVARGTRMTTWEYKAVSGISAEYGPNTGWVALQTPGASASDMSYCGTGNKDPAKAPNAIPESNLNGLG